MYGRKKTTKLKVAQKLLKMLQILMIVLKKKKTMKVLINRTNQVVSQAFDGIELSI